MPFLFQYLGQFGGVHTKLLQLRPRGAKVGVKTRMAVAHDGSMGQTVYLPTNLHKKTTKCRYIINIPNVGFRVDIRIYRVWPPPRMPVTARAIDMFWRDTIGVKKELHVLEWT